MLEEGAKLFGYVRVGERAYIGPYTRVYGPATIGDDSRIEEFCLIGVEAARKTSSRENELETSIGEKVVIRSHTVVYAGCRIDSGCFVGHNALLREHTVLGRNVVVGTASVLEGYCSVGDETVMQSLVYVCRHAAIGRGVFIGPNTVFLNDKHPPSKRLEAPVVEDEAVIGGNCTILPNVRVGRGALVGAGSVVTKDVPPYVIVAGNPAKPLGKRELPT